jgi:hypothetical protein
MPAPPVNRKLEVKECHIPSYAPLPGKARLPPAEAEVAEVRINPPEPAAGKKTPRPCRKPELPDSSIKLEVRSSEISVNKLYTGKA